MIDGSVRFEKKTVIITNAAGSVGLAAARLLHKENANIVLNDVRKEIILPLKAQLGTKILVTDFNLLESGSGNELSKATFEEFGSIDVLICNEGRSNGHLIEETTLADWDAMIENNLTAVFHALQGVYEYFRNNKNASVVLVSSIAARSGCGRMIDYASSMGGIMGIMKSVSREWSRWGVTCSAVFPGFIAEGDQGLNSKMKSQFIQTQVELANKSVTAEEVAKVILFLASEEGRPLNGQAINVDYGLNLYTF